MMNFTQDFKTKPDSVGWMMKFLRQSTNKVEDKDKVCD